MTPLLKLLWEVARSASVLPRIRLIHRRNFSGNGRPFQFAAQRLAALLALKLLPFQEFVTGFVSAFIGRNGEEVPVRTKIEDEVV